MVPFLAIFVVLLMLLSPIAKGELQFSIFQGNHHDSFNYLESSAVYRNLEISSLAETGQLDVINDGGLLFPAMNLNFRPTVCFVFATFTYINPESFFELHYAYTCSLLIIVFVSLVGLIQTLQSQLSSFVAILLGGLLTTGFWGQYIIDINSWSQVAWAALPIASTQIVTSLASSREESNTWSHQACFTFLFLNLGALYIYPEGASFFFLPLFATFLLVVILRKNYSLIPTLLLLSSCLALFLIPIWESNIKFLLIQKKQATSSIDWWNYFQAFFGGRNGYSDDLLANLGDGLAAFWGAYFFTAPESWGGQINNIVSYAWLVFSVAFLTYSIIRAFRSKNVDGQRMRFDMIILGVLICQTLIFVLMEEYWVAG
ncbi:MAG: hypothetical protein AB3N14_10900 [Flavobacteriaceae bacterium]